MDVILLRVMQLAAAGYCCSQILALLALETQGEENRGLVRAMTGLCKGLGGCEEVCGALSGGACVLALYAGQGSDEEIPNPALGYMLADLNEWFRQEFGALYAGVACHNILGEDACGPPHKERCGDLVARTFGRCLEILASNGIDATQSVGAP